MSGFWAQRLGVQPPAPVQASSSRPWWQAGSGIVVQPQQTAAPQQPMTADQHTQPQVHPQQTADGKVPIEQLLTQDNYSTTKAQSAKDSEVCPDCQSPNFMRSNQSPNSMKQCFNCGFNERFLHSTHGASGIGQKGLPVHTARNQVIAENNFQPQTVIGRVG